MIVMKFGGSSLRDAARINEVANIIKQRLAQRPVIVVSALGATTNALFEAGTTALHDDARAAMLGEQIVHHHLETARQLDISPAPIEALAEHLLRLLQGISLIGEVSARTQDLLVSFGERLAVRILAPYLARRGVDARYFDAWEVGLRTTPVFGNAEVLEPSYAEIATFFEPLQSDYRYTPVVTGFIGQDLEGRITSLGRGGSDLTAATLGFALRAEEVQVWKDVDGIMTADPRLVPTARPVASISFEEAAELAYFGAKVLHPVSMQPALRGGIPVRVKNSYNPEHPGTLVQREAPHDAVGVKALTAKRKVTVVDIVSSRMLGQSGFLAKVFDTFGRHQVSVDMVSTSEVSISLTLNDATRLDAVLEELRGIASVQVAKEKGIVSLIADHARASDVLARAFEALRRDGVQVQMISQGASKRNFGFVIDDAQVEPCLLRLHATFFEAA